MAGANHHAAEPGLAVLLLVFNRPEPTARVFEEIRRARPQRLYVAADGPREGRARDAEKIAEVRDLVSNVDWPCEVHSLFREENLGCKYAISTALRWFFQHEEQGIILEDDCVPHPDFFSFCDWGLRTYRDDKEVWHINGNTFGAPASLFGEPRLGFSALPQLWGWATWRDRWQAFQSNAFYLDRDAAQARSRWRISSFAKAAKSAHISALRHGKSSWGYHWQVTVLNHRGLCLTSASNLVTNIGDGPDATHTSAGGPLRFSPDKRINLPVGGLKAPPQRLEPVENVGLTSWFEAHMGLRTIRPLVGFVLRESPRRLAKAGQRLAARALFSGVQPVVVASVGRSGSTMLCDALAASLVAERFGLEVGGWLNQKVARLATGFSARLDGVHENPLPIIKTHDLHSGGLGDIRCVFAVCDPLISAQSVAKMRKKAGHVWAEEHIYNLQGRGELDELFTADILNYGAQLNSWGHAPKERVLVLDYEALWDSSRVLSDFVGYPVRLPPRRPRADAQMPQGASRGLFDGLRAQYRQLLGQDSDSS